MQREKGWVERPDCRLYFERIGHGPALIFAHGLGGNHLSWWQQVPHFCRTRTCITFSHRGFAPSSAPADGPDPCQFGADLDALVTHCRLSDAVVVAQSMGGWSAIDCALRNTPWLRGMVLSATSGAIDPGRLKGEASTRLRAWRSWSEEQLREGLARDEHPAAGAGMAARQPHLHYLYRSVDELTILDKAQMRERLYASRIREPDELASVRIPVLWVTGELDIVFPSPAVPALAAQMPNARHIQIPGVGHSSYWENAPAFNKLVEEFLTTERI